jgi:hypothetical protein
MHTSECGVLWCAVLQGGQAPLSDLQCTTSSEALLAGKAPTFRLLVWAIDRNSGESHVQFFGQVFWIEAWLWQPLWVFASRDE